MGCPKIVLKGNLLEIMSNWQISIGYGDNQIMTIVVISRESSYLHNCETILYITWHVTIDVTEYWLYIYL